MIAFLQYENIPGDGSGIMGPATRRGAHTLLGRPATGIGAGLAA